MVFCCPNIVSVRHKQRLVVYWGLVTHAVLLLSTQQ